MTAQLHFKYPRLVIFALLAGALILGVVLADNYGQSWDDPTNADYGEDVLRAYGGSSAFWRHRNLPYYGPAHFASSALLVKAAGWLGSTWHEVDVRHLGNYLAFLLGLVGLYLLARRFFEPSIALLGTLLFASQPMQFGHAFINQKDSPFSALFVLAVGVGFYAVASLARERVSRVEEGSPRGALRTLSSEWKRAPLAGRVLSLASLSLFLLALADALGQFLLLPLLRRSVTRAYAGEAVAPIQVLFDLVATDAYKTPLILYQQKATRVYAWTSVVVAIGFLILWVVISRRWFRQVHSELGLHPRAGLVAWLAAAAILGALISIRVAGPLAGLLVTGYYLQRNGLKRPGTLVLYWLVAALVSYLTWPTLWGAPLRRLAESLSLMGGYERHQVLYAGTSYASPELPWHYVPALLVIKHTLPAVGLGLLGLFLLVGDLVVPDRSTALSSASPWFALWVGLPLALVILGQSSIYGNIRHVFFVTPPLFVLACRGLQGLGRLARRHSVPIGILGLALIPGLLSILRLHPYEYTYYNALIGGVEGANGRYELDYWCTAYREAMSYVNERAQPGEEIIAWGPERVARSFARPDLEVLATNAAVDSPDFILTCDRAILEDWFYTDVPVVHVVGRGEAIYAEVKHAGD